jgi:hypothetical protein
MDFDAVMELEANVLSQETDAGKLVDPEPEAPAKKRKGKPSDSLVNDLIVPENPEIPSCKRQKCRFCPKTWAGRNAGRSRNHAGYECKNIPGTLRDRVRHDLANGSHCGLPRKLEKDLKQEFGEDMATKKPAHTRHCGTCTCGMPPQPWQAEDGKETIHHFAHRMDIAIVMMMVVCGLPSRLLDNPFFRNIFDLASPHYTPPSASRYTDVLLPREAALVDDETCDILRQSSHLTSSFDGLTTPYGGESLYTHHATTPDGDSFLIDAHHHSAASHTGSFLQDLVRKDIDHIGASHFSAQCSDNTGNTRVCREMTTSTHPWILNIADPSHHLHNTAKMVAEIPTVSSEAMMRKKNKTNQRARLPVQSGLVDVSLRTLYMPPHITRNYMTFGTS